MTTPVDTVCRFYRAIGRGDVSAVLSLLDAQIEWTEAERFPYYGGTWRGPQAVLDNLLMPLSRDWDGFSAKAHEFIAEGDRVVALGIYSGRFKKTGRSFSAAFAHVWTVHGDKLARFDMHCAARLGRAAVRTNAASRAEAATNISRRSVARHGFRSLGNLITMQSVQCLVGNLFSGAASPNRGPTWRRPACVGANAFRQITTARSAPKIYISLTMLGH